MLVPRAQDGYRKLGELPAAAGEDKIEVWTRTLEDGSTSLELVECSWGSGVGWYVQKRIRLDCVQVEALKALLGAHSAAATRPRRRLPTVVHEEGVIQLLFSA